MSISLSWPEREVLCKNAALGFCWAQSPKEEPVVSWGRGVLLLGCPSAVVFCEGGSALLSSPFCKITLFLCCFKAIGLVICRFLVLILHKCTLYIFTCTIYVRCKQNNSVLSKGTFLGSYRSGPSGYKRVTLPFWSNN